MLSQHDILDVGNWAQVKKHLIILINTHTHIYTYIHIYIHTHIYIYMIQNFFKILPLIPLLGLRTELGARREALLSLSYIH